MESLTNQNGILYEIAIAMGNSNELSPMLKEALTTMMRKLDGIATTVVTHQGETLAVYPRRGFNSDYLAPLKQINRTGENGLLAESAFDDAYAYYFCLPNTGHLVFVRRTPMEGVLLKMLRPVCLKLDNSIQACLAAESLQKKERELSESLMQLQLAQKTKDRFLANMSHEIRTPLNGILGFIEQLANTPLDAEQRHFVEIAQKSSHTLLGVINDILDFSKIESGQLEIDAHRHNLKNEIAPIIELFSGRAKEKDLQLQLAMDAELDCCLLFDNLRLKQVLTNLVGNAIKFTQQGEIRVSVECVSQTERSLEVAFRVTDSGIGISDESLAKIFSPFVQAEKNTTRNFGGTGLGLSISKQLVSLMGGELHVQSQLGAGASFFFTLSFERADGQATMPAEVDWHFVGSGQHILLVEDNKVNQLLMQSILKRFGLRYTLAENGVQAVEQFQTSEFDLVLMDINMPIMDGIEAFKAIQALYSSKQRPFVPVVALTANALIGDCDRYVELGMQDCLTKPLQLKALERVLAQQLSNQTP